MRRYSCRAHAILPVIVTGANETALGNKMHHLILEGGLVAMEDLFYPSCTSSALAQDQQCTLE